MKIALLGYGKMGKAIEKIAVNRGHDILLKTNENIAAEDLKQAEVVIEFSTPETVLENIKKSFVVNVPIVVGTTGWNQHQKEIEKLCQLKKQALFYASNFSIGVNLFADVNSRLAKLMNPYPNYQVEIEEIHHTQKLDAPSGTAITLASGIIDRLDRKTGWNLNSEKEEEINIISQRIGEVPGTHTIKYESEIDTIRIIHEAKGREGFALGAVVAAEWIANKKGVYTMKDLLKID